MFVYQLSHKVMEPTFTRKMGTVTIKGLPLQLATEFFIRDEGEYMKRSKAEIDELINDMPAVFETQDLLRDLETGEELTSGISVYIRN